MKTLVHTASLLFALLILTSCDFFKDDFEDPTPFLQYNATAEILGSVPDTLQVQVLVNNQHRTSNVVLVHNLCNVEILLTPVGTTASPIPLVKNCATITISSTIEASTSKIFSFEMPVEEIQDEGVPAGVYDVTAIIRFSQLERQDLPAGRIQLLAD